MQTGHQTSGVAEVPVREPLQPVQLQVQAETAIRTAPLAVGLLTGGQDRHYAVGLATALMDRGLALDVIGSDEVDGPEFQSNSHVRFRNFHGSQQNASLAQKISRILKLYAQLFLYTLTAKPRIFHILWNNKLELFERTILTSFYKLAGKKVVLTAHNVNAGRRDSTDSWLNRITLKYQYWLTDQIFVHTTKMKEELVGQFQVEENKVTVI